jgi:hypothetical protein
MHSSKREKFNTLGKSKQKNYGDRKMKNRIYIALTLLVISLGLVMSATAQKKEANHVLKFRGIDILKAKEAARNGNAKIDQNILAQVEAAYTGKAYEMAKIQNKANSNFGIFKSNLSGTWNVTVPGANPEDTFYALQTFDTDGTFVETSSLLATLTEGPAHGVWSEFGRGAILTFELFAFDAGQPIGRIRVRNLIVQNNKNHFIGYSVVDFIELDGTVIPEIGGGEYSADRMQLLGI